MADTRTAADKVEAARVRDWARDNGWPDLGPSGRIPAAARQAWHSRVVDDTEGYPSGDDPGPPYDDPGAGEGLPPPASLDEARQRAGLDPDAAHLRGRGRRQQGAGKDDAPVRVTPAVRRDITGKLAFWLSIPAEPWLRIDPYCGQAYADSFDKIAVRAAPLICQSPDLVRWFAKSSTFILWTELGMACRPVAEAVIAHHVTKRITLDSNGGIVEQKTGGVDFSAYSARKPNPAATAAA
jgi:hypothetical protein